MKSLAFATLALGAAALAPAQVNSVKIHERVFNDDSDSTLTTVNNYPSLVSFTDAKLDGDGMGSEFANRHAFFGSPDNGATDLVNSINTDYGVSMDVSLAGLLASGGEAGLIISSATTGDVKLIVKSNGEVFGFDGGADFHLFSGTGPVPPTIHLGIDYFTVGGIHKVTYTAGADTFTAGFSNLEKGIVDGRAGGYGQFGIAAGNAANNGSATFTNIAFTPVPEPASLAVLGLGLAFLRKRRAR